MTEALLGPVMMDVAGLELTAEDRELLAHPLVGGLILFSRNYENPQQLQALMRAIRAERQPLLIAVDYEGGRVQRFREGMTGIPAMRRLGELFDKEPQQARLLATDSGWLIGAELRTFDIDLSFAPVLDLDGGMSEVIGDRAFHHDPAVVISLASAFISGMQAAGMAATGKHYPGHGQVAPDSHQELPVDERDYGAMAADLAPFQALIEAGLPSVMMAHILYPAVDNMPASLSRHWIEQRLRKELGFTGVVFSDDMSMGGAAAFGGYAERCALALEAGCDMLPVCNNREGLVEVLDALSHAQAGDGHVRLSRLAGRGRSELSLRGTPQWHQARERLTVLVS